jgi:hypothetical protein
MNLPLPQTEAAAKLADLGYGQPEAGYVMHTASCKGLPLEQFARELMKASIHQTGHQMMAVWQGVPTVRTNLSLLPAGRKNDPLIGGEITFSALPERMTCRQAVAVAGAVAEWLIPAPRLARQGDEWNLFEEMRSDGMVPADDLALAGGIITWHAVKRAAKLLRRHWSIVALSAASKRTAFMYSLADDVLGMPVPARGSAVTRDSDAAGSFAAACPRDGEMAVLPAWKRPPGLFGAANALAR